MNIIEIITLNRHGDYQEVIFSSLLSYLLNPSSDHGLNAVFLQKIVQEAYPDLDSNRLKNADVKSEHRLGISGTGTVDIFVEMSEKVMAIEAKIWDQSARNKSKEGKDQVERYCDYLSSKYKPGNWRFIYLIPTFDSPKCVSEFKKALSKSYGDNLKLMAWNPPNEMNETITEFSSSVIEKSIMDIIDELLGNKDLKRVDIPLGTQWLLDSLYDFLPALSQSVPDPGKFPTKADLVKAPETWKIFDMFFTASGRWPTPSATTVGIPYGVGLNKSERHGNSLYRIRTTKDYYTKKEDKDKNLPENKVEIELWPEVYQEVKDQLLNWLQKAGLSQKVISDDKHLDSKKQVAVKLLKIDTDTRLSMTDVTDFNAILRSGFDKLDETRS